MKKLKFKKKINLISFEKLTKYKLNNNQINLINVDYKSNVAFKKISKKSKKFIENSFNIAFKIIKNGISYKLINGPISKKHFLVKSIPGITEYIAKKYNTKNIVMLIYNDKLSVSPITTHIPLKKVSKNINKKKICNNVLLINNFYKTYRGFKPRFGILGLNPHCESTDSFDEDKKIIRASVKSLVKLGINISGPFSADTIFIKNIRKNYDVIIGMYHDQVLTPIKTLFEYNAINITVGLPFIRISPDHGPNENMLGLNLSNPLSLIQAIKFLDKN